MNICFLNNLYIDPHVGGIERVTANLSSEFVRMGHNVICVYLNGDVKTADHSDNIIQLKLSDSNSFDTISNLLFIENVINRFDIKIVINQASYKYSSVDLCAKLRKRVDIKLVTTIHTDPLSSIKSLIDDKQIGAIQNKRSLKDQLKEIYRIVKYPISKKLRLRYICQQYTSIYNNTDYLVLLSDKFKPVVERLLNLNKAEKLYAISNPIIQVLEPVNLDAKRKQILYVGRLCHQAKRVDRLLYIWKLAQKKLPDWNLKIVGSGEVEEELKVLAKRLDLDRVSFVGRQDPRDYYVESQVICLTSSYEGFGMSLIEGQQHGCVPIAFGSYDSVRDIIDDGVNGVIIPAFNVELYALKLIELCRSQEIKSFALNGLESVKRFDSIGIANKWSDLFNAMLLKQ